MESRMRAASIRPKLDLRSPFGMRTDGRTGSGAGWRREVGVVEVEGVRELSVMSDDSVSAMLRTKMRGETFNTGDRPRSERDKRATTETLGGGIKAFKGEDGTAGPRLGLRHGLGGGGRGRLAPRTVRKFMEGHSRWSLGLGGWALKLVQGRGSRRRSRLPSFQVLDSAEPAAHGLARLGPQATCPTRPQLQICIRAFICAIGPMTRPTLIRPLCPSSPPLSLLRVFLSPSAKTFACAAATVRSPLRAQAAQRQLHTGGASRVTGCPHAPLSRGQAHGVRGTQPSRRPRSCSEPPLSGRHIQTQAGPRFSARRHDATHGRPARHTSRHPDISKLPPGRAPHLGATRPLLSLMKI